MFKVKKHQLLSLLCIMFTMLLMGCNLISSKKDSVEEDFTSFTNRIFATEVQQDTITLNFSLADPKAYGIDNPEVTFGEFSVKSIEDNLIRSENYLSTLKQFNYNELSESDKLTYDILKKDLELELELGDYILYTEILGPTTGIQAQLPVLLAEYNFYNKNDIETYLKLLPQVYTYFKDIALFEKEKSEAGLFMNDDVANNIINQCNNFIEDKENNYLIEIFNERIDNFPGLTKKEIANYKKLNQKAVVSYIIPAYELLIKELGKLKGTGTNEGGLAHYKKGKEYYEYLLATRTGSAKSVPELKKMLESSINTNLLKLSTIITKNPSVYDVATNPTYSLTDPSEIVEYLKAGIERDFPAPPEVNYSIKYVHESLQEYLSPAMYLIPAVDNYQDNIIYINNNPSYDMSQIYPTIAHEGYPGHLYQSVYFRSKNPSPIRSLLSFGGYVEGWATYVEYHSFYSAGFDLDVASFLDASMAANMALYCRLDIGIHYDGWSLAETTDYLKQFGLTDDKTIQTLYTTMLDEPALYPQYGVGYLEFINLKNIAKKELGNKFNLKEFHTFLLDIGPSQFDVIESRLHTWAKSK